MAPETRRKRGRPSDPGAGYRRLAAELRKAMDAGRYPPGRPLPPTRALQKEYAVSYRTVWLAVSALKQEGRLVTTAGRRLEVLAAESRGASLLRPVLLVIGHGNLASVLRNPSSRDVVTGIGMGAGDVDAPLLTVHQKPLQRRLPDGFGDGSFRGILLFGHFRRSVLRAYERAGVPAVLVDWPVRDWKGHSLHVDNHAAALDAVTRLAALGHRQIAFVRYVSMIQRDIDYDGRERAAGFRKALRELELPSRRETVFTLLPKEAGTPRALTRLLKAKPAFTAVIAAGPGQARKTIEAARLAGRKVPRDLSVASFRPMSPELDPQLAGPSIDFLKMGRQAIGLLAGPASPARQLRFPAVWKRGKTVAAPPG